MYCTNCGKKNDDDSRFCMYCCTPFADIDETALLGECPKTEGIVGSEPTGKKKLKLKLIIPVSVIVIMTVLLVVFRGPVFGKAAYVAAGAFEGKNIDKAIYFSKKSVELDENSNAKKQLSALYIKKAKEVIAADPEKAIEMIKYSLQYYEEDNSQFLAEAYMKKAEKEMDENIDTAISTAKDGLEEKETDELKKILGKAYVKKAKELLEKDPGNALKTANEAKKYSNSDEVTQVIKASAEKLIGSSNADSKIENIIYEDIFGNQEAEIIALLNNADYLTLKVFSINGSAFDEKSSYSIGHYKFTAAKIEQMASDKQLLVSIEELSGSAKKKVSVFSFVDETLNSLGEFSYTKDFRTEDTNNDGNKELILVSNYNDIQKHTIEMILSYNGAYNFLNAKITREAGDFNYPNEPENVAKCYLEALAAGADDEIGLMSYTGDISDMSYPNIGLASSKDIIWGTNILINSITEVSGTYSKVGNEKIYQSQYYREDNTNSLNNVYILLKNDGSKWLVYGISQN